MRLEDELLELKHKIDEAKTSKAKIEGQIQELMSRLKSDFNVDTIEEAEKLLSDKRKEMDALNSKLEKGLESLKQKFPKD